MSTINRFSLVLLLTGILCQPLAASEPWGGNFTPPKDDYSWIKLDTGEWLKGELIALYDETLAFDSDHFGVIDIDLGDIEAVHGSRKFVVSFSDGRSVSGTLSIRGGQVQIAVQDNSLEFDLKDVVSITQTVERERDRWTGNVDVGMNLRQGNTEFSDFNVSAGFTRRTPVSRISLDYRGNSNVTDGVRQTDSHRINLGVNRFTGGRFFWRPVSVQYYKDELQNINHQATIDSGFGYHLMDTSRVSWEVQAGVGGNYLENVSGAAGETTGDWSPVGTLGMD